MHVILYLYVPACIVIVNLVSVICPAEVDALSAKKQSHLGHLEVHVPLSTHIISSYKYIDGVFILTILLGTCFVFMLGS